MPKDTVTFVERNTGGTTVSTTTNVLAFRSPQAGGWPGFGQGGVISSDTCRYHLAAEDLAVRPKKGDRIVSGDGSGTWEVEKKDVKVMGTVYVTDCRKVPS